MVDILDVIADIKQLTGLSLVELRDKLREGKFIELPCKVGDTVYEIERKRGSIFIVKIDKIELNNKFVDFHGDCKPLEYDYTFPTMFSTFDIGKTVFFTREEAEQALKESE